MEHDTICVQFMHALLNGIFNYTGAEHRGTKFLLLSLHSSF